MGIKLDISEDYTFGQIAFDCQSIDDVRKIGDILGIVGFNMRFANIEIKDKAMQKELKLILLKINHYIFEIQDCLKQVQSLYETENSKMPSNIEFMLAQFKNNEIPAMRKYLEDIWPEDKEEAVSLLDFKYELSLNVLKEFENYVNRIGSHLDNEQKKEVEQLKRLINFRYVQEIRQIIYNAKRLNMLRESK